MMMVKTFGSLIRALRKSGQLLRFRPNRNSLSTIWSLTRCFRTLSLNQSFLSLTLDQIRSLLLGQPSQPKALTDWPYQSGNASAVLRRKERHPDRLGLGLWKVCGFGRYR